MYNQLLSAFDEFKKATFNLVDRMLATDSIDFDFSEDYPFNKSFDELYFDIVSWINTQTIIIKGANDNVRR